MSAAGDAGMVVRAWSPLGLLSVRMREHREKEKDGGNVSKKDDIQKEGRFASPGTPSILFPHILLTLVAKQSVPAAKPDIPQGPLSIL